MWPCVILLIHSQIPMCLKHWCYKWSQHVISVSLCIQRSVIKMQGCLVSVWNSCPDHNTTSAPTVDFMYAASSISLTSSPTHMYTAISTRQVQARFVWKQNFLPPLTSPRQMLSCPFQSLTLITLSKYWIFEWTTSSETVFPETTPNSLGCDSWPIVSKLSL
jgi:hypothetical protein